MERRYTIEPSIQDDSGSRVSAEYAQSFLALELVEADIATTLPTDYTNSEQTWSRYLQPNQLKNSAAFSFLHQTSRARKAAITALDAQARPTLVLLGQADALAAPHLFYEATRLAPGTTGNRPVEVVSKATHAAIVEPENKIIATRTVSWVTQRLLDARKESR